jgi:hypothetical protein
MQYNPYEMRRPMQPGVSLGALQQGLNNSRNIVKDMVGYGKDAVQAGNTNKLIGALQGADLSDVNTQNRLGALASTANQAGRDMLGNAIKNIYTQKEDTRAETKLADTLKNNIVNRALTKASTEGTKASTGKTLFETKAAKDKLPLVLSKMKRSNEGLSLDNLIKRDTLDTNIKDRQAATKSKISDAKAREQLATELQQAKTPQEREAARTRYFAATGNEAPKIVTPATSTMQKTLENAKAKAIAEQGQEFYDKSVDKVNKAISKDNFFNRDLTPTAKAVVDVAIAELINTEEGRRLLSSGSDEALAEGVRRMLATKGYKLNTENPKREFWNTRPGSWLFGEIGLSKNK